MAAARRVSLGGGARSGQTGRMPGDDAIHDRDNDVGAPGNPTARISWADDQHQLRQNGDRGRQQLQRARP
jgi:hypothetical protein